jgi:hypothetical protein
VLALAWVDWAYAPATDDSISDAANTALINDFMAIFFIKFKGYEGK